MGRLLLSMIGAVLTVSPNRQHLTDHARKDLTAVETHTDPCKGKKKPILRLNLGLKFLRFFVVVNLNKTLMWWCIFFSVYASQSTIVKE